eukprot:c38426_g1_i1 orf=286-465(-)
MLDLEKICHLRVRNPTNSLTNLVFYRSLLGLEMTWRIYPPLQHHLQTYSKDVKPSDKKR